MLPITNLFEEQVFNASYLLFYFFFVDPGAKLAGLMVSSVDIRDEGKDCRMLAGDVGDSAEGAKA